MNKLGWQVQTWTPEALNTLQRAPGKVLKLIDRPERQPVLDYKRLRRDGHVVARKWFGNNALGSWYSRVEAMWNLYLPIMDLVDYFEIPWNEDHQTGQGLSDYAGASVEAVGVIHSWGKKALVGNFSVGWPGVHELHLYYPALRVADGFSLHEYAWPDMYSSTLTFRYRTIYEALPPDCRKPIFLTEFGLDHGVADGRLWGWKGEGGPGAHQYAEQLKWAAREMAKDQYLSSAAIFMCGAQSDWASFDITGEVAIEEAITMEVQTPQKPVVGPGLMKAERLIGPYSEGEVWHWPGSDHEVSMIGTSRGHATWSKRTNEVVVYVNAGQELWRDYGNLRKGKLERA